MDVIWWLKIYERVLQNFVLLVFVEKIYCFKNFIQISWHDNKDYLNQWNINWLHFCVHFNFWFNFLIILRVSILDLCISLLDFPVALIHFISYHFDSIYFPPTQMWYHSSPFRTFFLFSISHLCSCSPYSRFYNDIWFYIWRVRWNTKNLFFQSITCMKIFRKFWFSRICVFLFIHVFLINWISNFYFIFF